MTEQMSPGIASGSVIEFFENKEVVCGVCLAVKNQRLNILTEHNREIGLSANRVIHAGILHLDMRLERDALVRELAEIASVRRRTMSEIRVEELWSLLESEPDGFDARELAEFAFASAITDHHVSAMQRVLFQDRLFFQFKDGRFYARPSEKVEARRLEIEREEAREIRLKNGAQWLHALWNRKSRPALPEDEEARLFEQLKGFCLPNQDAQESAMVKEMLKEAGISPVPQSAFRILVRLGVWHENQNLHLIEHGFTSAFAESVTEAARRLVEATCHTSLQHGDRRDLLNLHAITVDSPFTRDYDDALSLRTLPEGLYEVGVHIADAAQFVSRDDPLDREAEARASSIYLPDERIAMIPPELSEGLCSLRAGEERLAVSFLFIMDAEGTVVREEIVPSLIRIREQLTYQDVNGRVHSDEAMKALYDLSLLLRAQRLAGGATILPLPEIQVTVNQVGMIQVYRYEKEVPSQIMVSEWMIAANRAAASYLAEREIPAIFRSQGECRPETDLTQSEHELFRVYRQRRLFARAELDTKPQQHCSLGLPCYTTVTSPIRRYTDLIVQRQLKHALAQQEALYSAEELGQILTRLNVTQGKVFLVQRKWNRYWILKYMEQEDIRAINALVLDQNDRFAHLLLPDFLLETNVPLPEKTRLPKGNMIRVKVERINPRDDVLRLQLADLPRQTESTP